MYCFIGGGCVNFSICLKLEMFIGGRFFNGIHYLLCVVELLATVRLFKDVPGCPVGKLSNEMSYHKT